MGGAADLFGIVLTTVGLGRLDGNWSFIDGQFPAKALLATTTGLSTMGAARPGRGGVHLVLIIVLITTR